MGKGRFAEGGWPRVHASAAWCIPFLLILALAAHAQTPPPLTVPSIDLKARGEVLALARMPDGGLVVGGRFSTVYVPELGLTFDRANLVRYNADGSLNPSWNPSPNGVVRALHVDAAGNLYVGGEFTQIGGIARVAIARVSGSPQAAVVDAGWNAGVAANGFVPGVYAIAGALDGALYVGGGFSTIGGQARKNLAKVSALDALADAQWNPEPNAGVFELRVDGDGALFVRGGFFSMNGTTRRYLAKLAGSGTATLDPWDPNALGGSVSSIDFGAPGELFVAGGFTEIGGVARAGLAKLSRSGAAVVDANWNPQAQALGNVFVARADGNGNVYVGGAYTPMGGVLTPRVVRVSGTGTGALDAGWTPVLQGGSGVTLISPASAGSIAVGGSLDRAGGQLAIGLARIATADGATLSTGVLETGGYVNSIARAADGTAFLAGRFVRANAEVRNDLVKVLPDGSVDPTWNPSPGRGDYSVTLDDAGRLYVYGNFFQYGRIGGAERLNLARLSTLGTGAADPDWNPITVGSLAYVLDVVPAPGDTVYLAGGFSTVAGQARPYLARVSALGAGALDVGWNPAPDNFLTGLQLGPGDSIYAMGQFANIGGQPRARLARLSTLGAGLADATWNPAPDGAVYDLAQVGNDTLVVGGAFRNIGGAQRRFLAKISTGGSGTAVPDWNPSPDDTVTTLYADGGPWIHLGGSFTTFYFGATVRSRLARLSLATPATADPEWQPEPNAAVTTLAGRPDGTLWAGGSFANVGGTPRALVAAFSTRSNVIHRDGFE